MKYLKKVSGGLEEGNSAVRSKDTPLSQECVASVKKDDLRSLIFGVGVSSTLMAIIGFIALIVLNGGVGSALAAIEELTVVSNENYDARVNTVNDLITAIIIGNGSMAIFSLPCFSQKGFSLGFFLFGFLMGAPTFMLVIFPLLSSHVTN